MADTPHHTFPAPNSRSTADARPRWTTAAFTIVGVATLLRILLLAVSPYSLYGDEAYYWGWSRELAFGYYSKPPMLAWTIRLTTSMGGNSEFWVRLGAPILYGGTALLCGAIGRRLFGSRAGFWSTLLFTTMPAVFLGAILISTDAVFLFFWALTLRFFIEAVDTDRWHWWLLTGLAGGCGMLSKYTMVVAAASCGCFMLGRPALRKRLFSPKLWAGAALGVLVYLPNLLWNAANGFASYRHTNANASLGGDLFHPNDMLEFVGAQFGVMGPVLFGILLFLVVRRRPGKGDESERLLFWFVVPMLGLITVLSLLSRAHANWAAPMVVGGVVWTAAYGTRGARHRLLVTALAINVVLGIVLYAFHPLANLAGTTLTKSTDPYKRIRGWKEVIEKARPLVKQYPALRVLGDDRIVLAEILYYLRDLDPEPVKWNPDGSVADHYELTTNMKHATGEDFLYITEGENADRVSAYFDTIEPLATLSVPLYPDFDRVLRVYYLRGFRGY